MLRGITSALHPVIPDAPQHQFGGAVLIRDRRPAIWLVGGKIPCLRRNMKDVAPRTG